MFKHGLHLAYPRAALELAFSIRIRMTAGYFDENGEIDASDRFSYPT